MVRRLFFVALLLCASPAFAQTNPAPPNDLTCDLFTPPGQAHGWQEEVRIGLMGSMLYLLDARGCPISPGFHVLAAAWNGYVGLWGGQRLRFRMDKTGAIIEECDAPYPPDEMARYLELKKGMCPAAVVVPNRMVR